MTAKDKPENECLGSLLRTAIARRHPTRAAGSATRARSAPMGVPPGRITETGTHPACLTDGMPHRATLVSVFCIPPSYNSTVDAAADLPGPGAVALTGKAQLLRVSH